MNADRWRLAHEYHRQRQNVHYQSLNQPGIVCGLGVHIIAPPADVRAQYRDGRWLQIQPGIAIDLFGNFIVVTEPENYRIVSENRSPNPLMVYLTISYVDPEKLQLRRKVQGELLRETFRIDEKSSSSSEAEVELCRILLPACVEEGVAAPVQLENPIDVFFPGYNNLDLRYRIQARSRPQSVVRVAQVNTSQFESTSVQQFSNLSYLLQSVEALYPAMGAADEIGQVTLLAASSQSNLLDYDVLYLKAQPSLLLTQGELEALRSYLETGGVLLVDADIKGTRLEELRAIKQQLQEAIARIDIIANIPDSNQDKHLAAITRIRPELEAELAAAQAELDAEISDVCVVFKNFAQQLGTPLENLENLSWHHPLRTQPFLFAALPTINEQPIQLLTGGGIVVIIGDLSSAWGLDEKRPMPRETIRTAQEMGINLLHFAWRKRQLTPLPQQGTQPVPPPEKAEKEKPARSQRLQSALDKLI